MFRIFTFNIIIFLFFHGINGDNSYQILTLSQSWPQTSCWDINRIWQEVNAPCTNCKLPRLGSNWTIHGLWPTNRFGVHPEFCTSGNSQGINGLTSGLQVQLDNKWPGLKINHQDSVFWKYQYDKHGTCAADNESTNTYKKYFLKAIELLDNHNIGKIFEDAGIRPGAQYTYKRLSKVIEKNIGTNTYIKCNHDPVSNLQYIRQIHICYEKTFTITNCTYDTHFKTKTNCKKNEKIIYPARLNAC